MSCRAPVPPLDPLFDRWSARRVIHVIHDTSWTACWAAGASALRWRRNAAMRDAVLAAALRAGIDAD